MAARELERQIAAIAALAEPIRRGLYLYVLERRREVGRDEAARALHVSRALAAFHLDKLVEQRLLDISFRRLTGRRGPGAGRPAKLYRRSTRQLDVSLPERRYALAGRVLVRALADAKSAAGRRSLARAADSMGRSLASAVGPRPRGIDRAVAALAACGYAPERRNGAVRLTNCPFDALAQEDRPTVCGMNLALVRGLLTGLGTRGVRAELRPEPGSCCVLLRSTGSRNP